jgi:K(+)-stimulated pyrophosphate-energized sodium pump
MKRTSEGESQMIKIASYVREGAIAYLSQQYKVASIIFLIISLIFVYLGYVAKIQNKYIVYAFIIGGFLSGFSGYLGMRTATDASARTANAAKTSLNSALKIAFRSGAVMGLIVVGLAILYISLSFIILHYVLKLNIEETATTMVGFGVGASFMALFARVGGGIFTKGADVGADLVGKVEAGIPEDDPRNPAVIADNVGDNVGDVAGMGADLFESYVGASMALAVTASLGFAGVILPLVIAGLGIISSIIGIFVVRSKEEASQKQLLKALSRGINLSAVLIAIFTVVFVIIILPENKGIIGSILTGLVVGIIIGKSTEYYTSSDFRPTRTIAESAQTGAATVILQGLSIGMISTVIPVLTIGLGILISFAFAGGFSSIGKGLYGIGIAAVGMLSTLGITLSTDAYGPIADNAGGNAEMTKQKPFVRERTDALDALGNTTAATGKGFAIGSAALTTMALISAYFEEIKTALKLLGRTSLQIEDKIFEVSSISILNVIKYFQIHLLNVKVIIGIFIGAMMVFAFCSMTLRAVGKVAYSIVLEVRRQFKEIIGLLKGKAKADYATCVKISTAGAQKAMIIPSLMAIFVPVLTGYFIGISGVTGLLLGSLSAGFIVAVMMANSGAAWDNGKKYIEQGNLGGKGSQTHKASIVGDTVGDPFKDTAGPSLNILLKLMSMVSIIFSGFTLKYGDIIEKIIEKLK